MPEDANQLPQAIRDTGRLKKIPASKYPRHMTNQGQSRYTYSSQVRTPPDSRVE